MDGARANIPGKRNLVENLSTEIQQKIDWDIKKYRHIHSDLRLSYRPKCSSNDSSFKQEEKPSVKTIAIQVRRADVSEKQQAHRYMQNESIVNRIQALIDQYKNEGFTLRVLLYSVENENDFDEELAQIVKLRLNQVIFQTFDDLHYSAKLIYFPIYNN